MLPLHIKKYIVLKENCTNLYILLKSYKTVTPRWTSPDKWDELELASWTGTRILQLAPGAPTCHHITNITHKVQQHSNVYIYYIKPTSPTTNYSNQILHPQCTHQLAKTWCSDRTRLRYLLCYNTYVNMVWR